MRTLTLSLLLAVTTLLGAAAPQAQHVAPAPAAQDPDWAALVGPFPELGSPEAAGELAVMTWLQRTRTAADVQRATLEVEVRLARFADVLGPGFDPGAHPATQALLDRVYKDSRRVVGPLKDRFKRPRPYLSNPALEPALPRSSEFSYPSGHAFLGALFGRILADLAPARKDAILERGALIGNDRTMVGMHWPSDVVAGQKLGSAFAELWLRDPAARKLVEEVRAAEWR